MLPLLRREVEIECGQGIVDVVGFGCTDDGSGHGGLARHPGQRNLRPGHLPLSSDSSDLVNDDSITRSIKV
ncbi:MAG: hypothetical protein K0S98_1590, partial [Propionibacteriaceae bacterium]|nr:hypothetical protein [Propionibacteriaceae bacterium]